MNIRSILILFILSFYSIAYTQENAVLTKAKKSLNITRATSKPKIDGVLDDKAWENAEIATDFIQFKPDIGNTLPKEQRTEVPLKYKHEVDEPMIEPPYFLTTYKPIPINFMASI